MICPLCRSSAECIIGTFYVCSGPSSCRNSKEQTVPNEEEIPENMHMEWRKIRYTIPNTPVYVDEFYMVPTGTILKETVVADSPSTIIFTFPSDTYSWEEHAKGAPVAAGTYLVYPPRYYVNNYINILVNHPQKKVLFFNK